MENSLKTIQTFSKIACIVSKVLTVVLIVSSCLSLFGIVAYQFGSGLALKLGGININNIVEVEAGITKGQIFVALVGGALVSAVGAVVAALASKYFKNELAAGTPFTKSGADELFRLGVIAAVISVASSIVISIAFSIAGITEKNVDVNIGGGAVGLGIFFIVLSFICRYGAEISEKANAAESAVESIPEAGTYEVNE